MGQGRVANAPISPVGHFLYRADRPRVLHTHGQGKLPRVEVRDEFPGAFRQGELIWVCRHQRLHGIDEAVREHRALVLGVNVRRDIDGHEGGV